MKLEVSHDSDDFENPATFNDVSRFEDLADYDKPTVEFDDGTYIEFDAASVISADGNLSVGTFWQGEREKYGDVERIERVNGDFVLYFSDASDDESIRSAALEWISE